MGNKLTAHAAYSEAQKLFSPHEIELINGLYDKLKDSKLNQVSRDKFKNMVEVYLPPKSSDCLFNEMTGIHGPEHKPLSKEMLTVGLAHFLKGDLSQKSEIILKLATTNKTIAPAELLMFMQTMISAYMKIVKNSPNLATWKLKHQNPTDSRLAHHLLTELLWPNHEHEDVLPKKDITVDEIHKWLQSSAISFSLINRVFHYIFPITPIEHLNALPIIPACETMEWSNFNTQLDLTSLLVINNHCPLDYRNVWRLLYSPQVHGESYTKLVKHIVLAGPCVVLIKERNGNLFGGFASTKLIMKSHFQGDDQSFLFSLTPHLRIYHTASLNDNYVYLNAHQNTVPNAFGFGGQQNYFGLVIKGNVHEGSSHPCITYKSPQLSESENFDIDSLEIWGVGPENPERKAYMQKKLSLLDIDPETKAMLTLINKGPYSEGMRADDPTSDTPEVKSYDRMSFDGDQN